MTPGTGTTLTYGFDASSNLTTIPTGGTGTYDKAGELTSATLSGATTTYAYNADGQRLTATQGSTTFSSGTWNGAGQLTAYTDSAASMTAAAYNGDGLRMTATTSTGTQNYTWDTTSGIPQVLTDSDNAYIYCGGLAPAEQVNLSTGTITYLVHDLLGSVRGTVSSSGSLTGTASYDAWGNPKTPGGLTTTTPYGYAGAYTDPTGLTYLINRYYDPATGQFISSDPMLSQTLAPYSYADDNPVGSTDPTGLLHLRIKCCPSIYMYFTWKFTLALAMTGKGAWLAVLVTIENFIRKYIPPPLDDLLIEKIEEAIADSVSEAIKIVGGTSKEAGKQYRDRKNKRCLLGDVYQAWLNVYSRWDSYRRPKPWCLR